MDTLLAPDPAPVRPRPWRSRLLVTFVVVLVGLDLLARAVGGALPDSSDWYHDIAQVKAEQLQAMHGEELDLVFAGTSQTYYGVDADAVGDALGLSAYNAGIPAGVPLLQERWLEETVLGHVSTDTVVWGLSVIDVNDNRDLSVVSSYDEAYATRRGRLAELDRRAARWSGLVRHRRQLTDPEIWRAALVGDDVLAASRAILRDDGMRVGADNRMPTDRERRRVASDVVGDFTVGEAMLDSMRATVESLVEQGIEVVLTWLPVPERLLELLPSPSLEDEARRAVVDLADDLGVPILDLSNGFGDEEFVDFTHLGPDGAEHLSHELTRSLEEIGVSR